VVSMEMPLASAGEGCGDHHHHSCLFHSCRPLRNLLSNVLVRPWMNVDPLSDWIYLSHEMFRVLFHGKESEVLFLVNLCMMAIFCGCEKCPCNDLGKVFGVFCLNQANVDGVWATLVNEDEVLDETETHDRGSC
jgi:hypothetical protein